MEQQNKEDLPAGKAGKKSNGKYIFFIIFLCLLSTTLGWLLWLEKQNVKREIIEKTVYLEKNTNLLNDLDDLKDSFSDLKTDNDSIRQELDVKIKQIEQMKVEAAKHKDDAYIIGKLRKETETLRKIMKGFVVVIDSLNTLNKTLVAEKEEITHTLKSEKKKVTKLEQDKEELNGVIELAAILKASTFRISGVRYSKGGKKENETNKAKKVEKLRIGFTIGENKVTRPGDKEIYLRVLTPDGKELFERQDEMGIFTVANNTKNFYYAAKQSIGYGNQEYIMTLYCASPGGFVPGTYNIEVYEGGMQIGKTFYALE